MKKMNMILRKCKSLSKLGRSSSYSSLRSKSTREEFWGDMTEEERREAVFVGRSQRRYMIDAKLLDHPLMIALIEKSKHKAGHNISVKCEVVIFDHLLWMLENADPNLTTDSLEELAELYAY
ncbi:auxin-responsive protein SAUR78 [Magnolia sinica]|uniref:auxin-responsive protein SAUR78 n=1 Tax=Magnolia sinica TaxID=86752 RepID=UPI0026599803|nr:auxin-responsive protein SAUR78 [Magnolia sinica]